MTGYTTATLWVIILGSAAGTYFLRWSFLGALGGRAIPEWGIRLLRYTAVAVLPGLVAPGVLWPPATGGDTDPARLAAAFAALAAGLIIRNLLAALGAGMGVFWLVRWLTG